MRVIKIPESTKIWVTSDTHFGHANIIKYANRPFKNVQEMDQALIDNWNRVVGHQDSVFFLGDFAMGDPWGYIRRLNGSKTFILGNHDRRLDQTIAHDVLTVIYKNQEFFMSHYAHRVWNKSHHGTIHLYGHSHGSLPDDPHARSMDVGVDANNYTPVAYEQIMEHIDKKIWKPIGDCLSI
jgi:calcineurin-like phosphoesterase family protein